MRPPGPAHREGRPTVSTRIAIAGLGAIGRVLARGVSGIPGLELACVAARDAVKARAWLDAQPISCPIVPLSELPAHADLAVECAPAAVFHEICRPMLEAGKRVMVLSAGALLPRPELIELARARGGQIVVPTGALLGRRDWVELAARHGARILVPSGAIAGLDGVKGGAIGAVTSVSMETRKPPQGLAGAPYLVAHGISVEGLSAPKRVFSGTAREAAAGFPANVNVAAALSLAGIGPDRTMIEIWADLGVSRNCHSIEVDSDSARFTLAIENVPSENPRTGRITALSVLAALRKLHAPLRVGT